jgi:hypothetical protein
MGWVVNAPAALPPGETLGTHRVGGWVGPRAGLDGCGISLPHRDSIHGPSWAWVMTWNSLKCITPGELVKKLPCSCVETSDVMPDKLFKRLLGD